MKSLDELFAEMATAVSQSDQAQFDALEGELLRRYGGGFSSMPSEIYERYLELDRGWPAFSGPQADTVVGRRSGRSADHLGPRTQVSARLPEELIEWLAEICQRTGANRSEVLTACLLAIRRESRFEQQVLDDLSQTEDGGQ